MTLADIPISASDVAETSARPVWRSYGGGGLALGGLVLLCATFVEWAYYAQGAVDDVLLLSYGVTFVAALVVLAVSTVPLAFGSTGRDGVVGRSLAGRIALVGYGWVFLAAQVALLLATFAGVEAASTVNLVLTLVQTGCAVVAVVVVYRARIARGAARWSLALSVLVGIVAGVVSNVAPSLDVVMAAFCLSAASIAFAGVTYVLWRPVRSRRTADAPAPRAV